MLAFLTLRRTLAAACVVAFAVMSSPPVRVGAQVRPVYSLGASGTLQQIQRLRTTGSALHTAAHPDDEDSAFIARVARGDHARVAYLSLNRGEGGQNVIGPELFEALGVIRTEELLQARTLDGGEQFFTRTFDYGFSKTIDEAAQAWGEQRVLEDMVRVIRAYRPLVIYSRFSGSPADGHGHHQLAGKLTPLAFKAAADPAQFPEQIESGLRPWQAKKLYRGSGFRPEPGVEPTCRLDTGTFDPLLGRSYFEIAAEGRSQHKSQEMGVPESRGRQQSNLILLGATVTTGPGETSVFAGLDTSIPGLAGLAGLPAGALKAELAAIDEVTRRVVDDFRPVEPWGSVPLLAKALRAIRAARSALPAVAGASEEARADADFLLGIEEGEAVVALQRASGLVLDALSDAETVAPGESVVTTVRAFVAQPAVASVKAVSLEAPRGWTVLPTEPPQPDPSNFMARFFRENPDRTDAFRVTVAAEATPTQPYWLEAPRDGRIFTWPAGGPASVPFAPPLVTARVEAEIGGVPVTLAQPVQFRLIDQVRGELRRRLNVVPAITLALDSQLEIVPAAKVGRPRRVAVRLQNNAQTPQSGALALTVPAGWTVEPAETSFSLRAKGERAAVAFTVTPGPATAQGAYTIGARATADGRVFDRAMRTVAYPHIQTHRLYVPAQAHVRVIDLAVSPVKVGYVMGSGDQVPDALRRLGLDVTMLDEDALAAGDLSRFDTIVVGIRASEARPDFVAANNRLLDYARAGGTLIVQYQQSDYVARALPPLPAQMASRVTDETAPVRILAPDHPVFTRPNRIGADDFSGWVQERNLYAFTTFDPGYTALLETADPGEAAQRGGQVYVRLGRGQYVYTAYSWFRQLPAGVPGAYRMLANLVSLGAGDGVSPR